MSIFKRKPKPQPAAVSDAPVPVHIAIIMDGNGRWAKRRGMPRYAGHAYVADMDKNRVRFVFFGDLTRLSPELQTLCQQAADRSRQYDGVQVNFCLNYGGRDEILRAARRFAQACLDGKAKPEDLTAARFSSLLYSAGVPDPELVIRPSGELRTSNFLLWQTAYSEYVFLDKLWPDFTAEDLDAAIDAYRHRSRRFGGAKP